VIGVGPRAFVAAIFGLAACPASPSEPGSDAPDPAAAAPAPHAIPDEAVDRDIESMTLSVDAAGRSATAEIRVAAGEPGASFAAAGLTIETVHDGAAPLPWAHRDGRLDVGLPRTPATVVVEYRYSGGEALEGDGDLTLTWPYHCGQLFPCDPQPRDGLRFSLSVTPPPGRTVVHPRRVDASVPAYVLAWAIGDHERTELGTTSGGTRVLLFVAPVHRERALVGTRELVRAIDWLERTYGPHPFGDEVGSVIVDWNAGRYGGMEHHPYWHVASSAADDLTVHVHEAAHGWFGNGVRIACWEDFVLSEGLATYLETRAIEQVVGSAAGAERWRDHEAAAERLAGTGARPPAWPEGCGRIDVLEDGLFGAAPYVHGALFLRDVARRIGADRLDAVLRDFYRVHRGRAARFDDLLTAIDGASGFDPRPCAQAWLRGPTLPAGC
jgi:hypothetical protein